MVLNPKPQPTPYTLCLCNESLIIIIIIIIHKSSPQGTQGTEVRTALLRESLQTVTGTEHVPCSA